MKIAQFGSPAISSPVAPQVQEKLQVLQPEQAARLAPAQVLALQKLYEGVLRDTEALRTGKVGCSRLTPADFDRLFPGQTETREVAHATAPNLHDCPPAEELRQDYRAAFRAARRGKGEDRLWVEGTTVGRTHSDERSVTHEVFRLDGQGRPVREVALPSEGPPTRTVALEDGGARMDTLLPGGEVESRPLPPGYSGGTPDRLETPWWREPDPRERWERRTMPHLRPQTVAQGPVGLQPPRLEGLSPNHSRQVQEASRAAFGETVQDGPAVQAFVARSSSPPPAPSMEQALAGADSNQRKFCERLSAIFAKLDKNGNGKVTRDEIFRTLPELNGEDATAAAALRLLLDFKDFPFQESLSREQLAQVIAGKGRSDAGLAFGIIAQDQGKLSHQLFVGEPNPRAVKQQEYGDCYFIAALVSKASQDPAGLKRMIKDNGDGTYTVSFAGRKPIRVSAPTDGEMMIGANSGENGMWASLLEKAYALSNNEEAWFPSTDRKSQLGGGRGADAGMSFFGARSTDLDVLLVTGTEATRAKLKKAFANGKMVTAGVGRRPWSYRLPDGHAYTVLGYDEKTDRITIRNPWGSGEPKGKDGKALDGNDDGVFSMSLSEFMATFSFVGYEE